MEQIVRQANFGKYAGDYAKHRAGFSDEFFNRLESHLQKLEGLRVLDVGTGTGSLARWFANKGANVTGLDFDKQMIKASKEQDSVEGVEIDYCHTKVDQTPFANHAFDLIIAGQCWHWFNHESATYELQRILKPKGQLAVAYFDWIGRGHNPVNIMYELKPKYVEEEKDRQKKWPLGFYPKSATELQFTNMKLKGSECWEEGIPYTYQSWAGRLRAYSGLGGRLDPKTLEKFEKEYSAILRKKYPDDSFSIPHKVWFGVWEYANR